jgi:hypothetical protein
MPLLDHFHPPLSLQRHWESFHTTWAGTLADSLNEDWLPPGYFAEEQVTFGGRVEIDVATFGTEELAGLPPDNGGIATLPKTWTAPPPTQTFPVVWLDELSVRIYSSEGGPQLVAAVELVSPANKDRPDSRRAFVAKCAAYLHQRLSLVVVDVVTSRMADLHRELLTALTASAAVSPPSQPLFAAAYRSLRPDEQPVVECWHEPLAVGDPLPRLPLFLTPDLAVPLDLELTYQAAVQRRRMGV